MFICTRTHTHKHGLTVILYYCIIYNSLLSFLLQDSSNECSSNPSNIEKNVKSPEKSEGEENPYQELEDLCQLMNHVNVELPSIMKEGQSLFQSPTSSPTPPSVTQSLSSTVSSSSVVSAGPSPVVANSQIDPKGFGPTTNKASLPRQIEISYGDLWDAFNLVPASFNLPLVNVQEKGTLLAFLGYPTLVVSSCQFSVCPLHEKSKAELLKLLEFEKEMLHTVDAVNVLPDTMGLFGYKCGDNLFQRIEANSSSMLIKSYDTGEHLGQLQLQRLFALPTELASLSPLRYKVSLTDLEQPSDKATAMEGRKFLHDKIWGKVVKVIHGQIKQLISPFIVGTLISMDESINYNDLLMEAGYVVQRPGKKTPVAPNIFGQQLQQQRPQVINSQSNRIPYHIPPMVDYFEIYPTVVSSPGLIWAQVFHEHSGNLEKLLEDLNTAYAGKINTNYVPSRGELCAARFSVDGLYYRAEVVCVNNNGLIDVQFVDYGNKETVSYGDVYKLQPCFFELPKQALCFALAGIEPVTDAWSAEACSYLREAIMQEQVRVRIVSEILGKYFVSMNHLESPDVLINEVMVERGFARRSGVMKGVSGRPVVSPKIGRGSAFNHPLKPKEGNFQEEAKPGKSSFDPKVPHLHISPRPLNTSGSSKGKQQQPFDNPIGSSWTPKMKNESKGNTFKQRSAVDQESHSKPHWNLLTEQDAGKKSYQANRRKGFAPENALHNGEEKFISQQSPKLSLVSQKIPIHGNDSLPFGSKKDEHVSVNGRQSVSIPTQTLPMNCKLSVVVVHVESPELFYVMSLVNAHELVKLSEELQTVPHQPVKGVEIGDFCLAKYVLDNCYGRVKVLRLKPNKALLRFVDYGNKQPVFIKDLYSIEPKYCVLPQQAIPCTLEGVAAPTGPWSQEAIQYFTGLILNKKLQMEPVGFKEENNIHVVKLVLESDIDVAVALAEHNYALLSSVPQPHPIVPADGKPKAVHQFNPVVMCESLRHISLSERTLVVVSDITSLSEFYVHVADQQTKENISKVIVPPSNFQYQPLTSSLPIGSLCCAKFAEDGNWYRACIVNGVRSDADESCEVHFIDFGNYATVSKPDISLCPEALISIPVLAIRCALKAIQPVMQWSPSAVEKFKVMASGKILQACVASKPSQSERPWLLTLTDSSGMSDDVDIGSYLQSQGLAVPSQQTTQTNLLPSLSSTSVSPAPVPSFPPAIISPPQLPKPEEKLKLLITEIKSPSNFYAEILTERTMQSFIQGLCQKLPSSYSNPSKYAGFKASVGAHCCAKFSQDGCWYRCQVIEVSGNSATLFYVDYGNTDTVPLSDLFHLDPMFTSLPAQAVHFSLEGVHPSSRSEWSSESVEYFKSIAGSPLYAVVCLVSEDSVVNVNLFSDAEFSQSVGETLVKHGLAVADVAMYSIPTFSLPDSTGSMVNVVISEVTSSSSLYIQVALPEVQRTLSGLQSALSTYAKSCPALAPNYTLKVGDFCCAIFYEDSCWYRAQVTKLCGKGKVSVLYVDFGNSATIQLSDVRPLTKELAEYPQVACCVSLANLASAPLSTLPSFRALTDGKILGMKVVNNNATPCEVVLYDSENPVSINDQLLKIVQSSKSACIPGESSSKPMVSIEPSYMPRKSEFSVMVVHIESLDKLFLQVTEADNIQNLMKLMENINAYCQTAPPLSSPPVVGQLCLAQFSGEYFRGKVLEVSGDRGRVLFIDFGNIDIVHFSNMRAIPTHLSAVPAQAMKCSLVATPFSDRVDQSAIQAFTSLVANIEVKCKVINRHPLIVDLQKNDISPTVHQMLCKDGHLPMMPDPSFFRLDPVVIPESCKVLAIVTEVEKPAIFWLQLFDQTALTEFQKVTVDLKLHCEQSQSMTGDRFLLGQLCSAKFKQDGCWYRARVIDFAANQEAIVQFVDFGNIQQTPATSLCNIPHNLLSLPAQGVPCFVSGCPCNCDLSGDVLGNTLNKQFHCLKKAVTPDGYPLVDLFDVTTGALMKFL